jgi:phosphoribosylanthranilate isomerase
MTKIKICGLSRPADIEVVNEVLPDYIGFVFAKSRRQISSEAALELKRLLNPDIQAVGVFVNEDIEQIIKLCKTNTIDIIQLHGDEDETYINQLRTSISNKIIKVVRVQSITDIEGASHTISDYLLFDAYKKEQYGGSGETFDWSLLSQLEKPYFLAGGIQNSNVLQAIDQVHPYGVDISSGVETDGIKDAAKIKEIVARIRSVR